MNEYEEFQKLVEKNKLDQASEISESLRYTEKEIYQLTSARLLLAQNKIQEAELLLDPRPIIKERKKRDCYNIIRGIIQAEFYIKKNKIKEAKRDLLELQESFKNCPILEKAIEKLHTKHPRPLRKEEVEEKEVFLKLYRENAEIKAGSIWFIIDADWLAKWKGVVGLRTEKNCQDLPFNILYEESTRSSLGTIDNSTIIDPELSDEIVKDESSPSFYSLKSGLTENLDYVLIPQPVFTILHSAYGSKQILRRIAIKASETHQIVEVFLKRLKVVYFNKNQLSVKFHNSSRKSKISDIAVIVIKTLGFNIGKNDYDKLRVWKIDTESTNEEKLAKILSDGNKCEYIEGSKMCELDAILDDAEVSESNYLFIDFSLRGKFRLKESNESLNKCKVCKKNEKILLCSVCKLGMCSQECLKQHKARSAKCSMDRRNRFSFFSCFCSSGTHSDNEEQKPAPTMYAKNTSVVSSVSSTTSTTPTNSFAGVISGLQNLGNTCFMNSAIQCLVHCEELSRFFLTKDYTKKINKSNPLGTKGKLAISYGELLINMRSGKEKSVAPWSLKKTVSAVAAQFEGYQQHDSHEFLCYLINGLHEDLNEIIKKPYDSSDIKFTNDQEVADESWRRHCSRNKSIIIDLMYGQYKSTLKCPKCQKFSYAFDPFNCLSLPIPLATQKKFEFNFVPYSLKEDLIHASYINEANSTILDLKRHIAEKFGKIATDIRALECKTKFPMKFLQDTCKLETLRQTNLYFYEIPQDFETFCVICISFEVLSSEFIYRVIGIDKNETTQDLLNYLSNYLKPLIEEIDGQDSQIAYKVYTNSNNFVKCFICDQLRCNKGCNVAPSSEKLKLIISKDNCFYIKVVFGKGVRKFDTSRYIQFKKVKGEGHTNKNSLSIHDCFRAFSMPETLDKNNSWYCPLCKTHVQADKKLEIYRVPPILIIHLKRFKMSGFYREKINVPIDFPVESLDISQYVIGETPSLYDLFAISNHFGTLSGGHYTATVLNEAKGKWFECNDSQVTDSRVISESASYVLFYKAKTSNKQ